MDTGDKPLQWTHNRREQGYPRGGHKEQGNGGHHCVHDPAIRAHLVAPVGRVGDRDDDE